MGDGFGVVGVCGLGVFLEEGDDVGEVLGAGLVDGVVEVGELDAGVGEEASAVVDVGEPAVEGVEAGEDGGAGRAVGEAFDELHEGVGLPAFEGLDGGDGEFVFGGEVVVEGGFGDTDGLDDAVEPDGVEAFLGEEVDGGGDDAFAGGGNGFVGGEELVGGGFGHGGPLGNGWQGGRGG